jgi:hypothetical protein
MVLFFLERIPQMQPQISLAVRPVGEPRMECWTSLSPRLGTDSEFIFTDEFFAWLRRQLIVIEDFPYVEVDFRGIMDLVLLDGMDWDSSGEKRKESCQVFFDFKFYIYFWGYLEEFLTNILFHCVDRGATRLIEIPTLGRYGDA